MKSRFSILLLAIMNAPLYSQAFDLQGSLLDTITNKNYVSPSQVQRARAQELFRQTLKGGRGASDLAADWATLGFQFREVERQGEMFWLVSEGPENQTGRGWYLFRTNRELNLALEAPHARNDINTGLLAFRFFITGKARALGASTITRHRADMGHLENTYFQAFTLAFAEACPGGLVAQLHGFESENHAGIRADIVASAGTRSPEPWFEQLVEDLKSNTPFLVFAYPRDTKALGATLNSQGRALQKSGRCRFVHLEMTAPVRERLTREEKACRAIMDCLSRSQNR